MMYIQLQPPITVPSYTLHFLRQPGQDFKGQGHYGEVNSRSHDDVAHLHPQSNVPTKYQPSTPHRFRDIAQTIF